MSGRGFGAVAEQGAAVGRAHALQRLRVLGADDAGVEAFGGFRGGLLTVLLEGFLHGVEGFGVKVCVRPGILLAVRDAM